MGFEFLKKTFVNRLVLKYEIKQSVDHAILIQTLLGDDLLVSIDELPHPGNPVMRAVIAFAFRITAEIMIVVSVVFVMWTLK
jgi:hypothetical protein